MIMGNKTLHFPSLTSTNAYAKTILTTAREGTVIIADIQSAGKGRDNRQWFSPEGGLWFSIILKPKTPSLSSLVLGIAICDALTTLELTPHIKWPNDILIGSKKIAGILTEIENDSIIAGIGLNINITTFPRPLKDTATSLIMETGKHFDKQEVLSIILNKFEKRYTQLNDNKIQFLLEDWRSYATMLGHEVMIEIPGCSLKGRAVDINEEGALLIKMGDGSLKKIIAGNCRIMS